MYVMCYYYKQGVSTAKYGIKPATTLRGGIKMKPATFLRANQWWISLVLTKSIEFFR